MQLSANERIVAIDLVGRTTTPSEVNGRIVNPEAEQVYICSTVIHIDLKSSTDVGTDE
ncbi:MAG: hypothetical protein ACQEXN_11975 [Actinomycetota bacterium]